MKDTALPDPCAKTFTLPYQLGVFLAANAVSDACVVVDGPDCVMAKADFIAGNHDLNSTLISPDGAHRIICSMNTVVPQRDHPEKALSALLAGAAGSGRFGAVLLTAMPFLKISGIDYAGVAAAASRPGVPAAEVPPASLEADWLDGYANSLEAMARALPASGRRPRRRAVALAGYLFDRNEGDHAGNIAELRRLLELCGLELACVFPSGGSFRELSKALEAGVVVSLPYGRKAAALLAKRSGAKLVETGLPMGLKGTASWLEAVCRAAGLKGQGPAAAALEREAALALSAAADPLAHRSAAFAGDPHLFAAFSAFAGELGIKVRAAVLNSRPVRPGVRALPELLMFSPPSAEAKSALEGLRGYSKPELLVGNSFGRTEGFCPGAGAVELGFPSYGFHCLAAEPFLGYEGAKKLAARMLNALWRPSGG